MKNTGSKSNSAFSLKAPRITEKASQLMERNVYTFDVPTDATKSEVVKAVKSLYKVTPEKIAMVKVPAKSVFVRGKAGTKQGGKKAYVYLKKGDKIEIA